MDNKALIVVSGIDIPDWYDKDSPYMIVSPSTTMKINMVINELPDSIYSSPVSNLDTLLLNGLKRYNDKIIEVVTVHFKRSFNKITSVDVLVPNDKYDIDTEIFKDRLVQWNIITKKLQKLNLA